MERLERFHNLGVVHLDIKPDNIVLGSSDPHSPEYNMLYLIDYGLSQEYLTKEGYHRKVAKAKRFVGNVGFASKHAFNKIGNIFSIFKIYRTFQARWLDIIGIYADISLRRKVAMALKKLENIKRLIRRSWKGKAITLSLRNLFLLFS